MQMGLVQTRDDQPRVRGQQGLGLPGWDRQAALTYGAYTAQGQALAKEDTHLLYEVF